MLVLESYKPFEVEFQEVAMTRANPEFDRASADREQAWRDRSSRKPAPADQLMYAWSIQADKTEQRERVVAERRLEMCPPEVYIG